MRNLLGTVPRAHAEMVAATVRTVFAQPDAASTRAHLRVVADTLRERFPAAAAILDDAETDVTDFPRAHHKDGMWAGQVDCPLRQSLRR